MAFSEKLGELFLELGAHGYDDVQSRIDAIEKRLGTAKTAARSTQDQLQKLFSLKADETREQRSLELAQQTAKVKFLSSEEGKKFLAEELRVGREMRSLRMAETWQRMVAEQGRLGATLSSLRERLGGFGSSLGMALGTLGGASTIRSLGTAGSPLAGATLNQSFQLASAVIGRDFVPVIMQASGYIQQFAFWWAQLDPALREGVVNFIAIGTATTFGLFMLRQFFGLISPIITALNLFKVALGTWALPLAIVAGTVTIIPAAMELGKSFGEQIARHFGLGEGPRSGEDLQRSVTTWKRRVDVLEEDLDKATRRRRPESELADLREQLRYARAEYMGALSDQRRAVGAREAGTAAPVPTGALTEIAGSLGIPAMPDWFKDIDKILSETVRNALGRLPSFPEFKPSSPSSKGGNRAILGGEFQSSFVGVEEMWRSVQQQAASTSPLQQLTDSVQKMGDRIAVGLGSGVPVVILNPEPGALGK